MLVLSDLDNIPSAVLSDEDVELDAYNTTPLLHIQKAGTTS